MKSNGLWRGIVFKWWWSRGKCSWDTENITYAIPAQMEAAAARTPKGTVMEKQISRKHSLCDFFFIYPLLFPTSWNKCRGSGFGLLRSTFAWVNQLPVSRSQFRSVTRGVRWPFANLHLCKADCFLQQHGYQSLELVNPPLTCAGLCLLFACHRAGEEEKVHLQWGWAHLPVGTPRVVAGVERPTVVSTLDLLLLLAFLTLRNWFQGDGVRKK